MLTRTTIDTATLAAARSAGLTPSGLVRRCVRRALARAVASFFGGALTPVRKGAGVAASSFCRKGVNAPTEAVAQ